VGLGGRGQEVTGGFLVDLERGLDYVVARLEELGREFVDLSN